MEQWKRPKSIPSQTEKITTQCGSLFLTFGYEGDRLIEVRISIGKSGICANVLLDCFARMISIALQSNMPRCKILKKIKKQFVGVKCNQGQSCVDIVAERIIKELK
jgi:ribonucleoside-diphosphate reductase alpha chain